MTYTAFRAHPLDIRSSTTAPNFRPDAAQIPPVSDERSDIEATQRTEFRDRLRERTDRADQVSKDKPVSSSNQSESKPVEDVESQDEQLETAEIEESSSEPAPRNEATNSPPSDEQVTEESESTDGDIEFQRLNGETDTEIVDGISEAAGDENNPSLNDVEVGSTSEKGPAHPPQGLIEHSKRGEAVHQQQGESQQSNEEKEAQLSNLPRRLSAPPEGFVQSQQDDTPVDGLTDSSEDPFLLPIVPDDSATAADFEETSLQSVNDPSQLGSDVAALANAVLQEQEGKTGEDTAQESGDEDAQRGVITLAEHGQFLQESQVSVETPGKTEAKPDAIEIIAVDATAVSKDTPDGKVEIHSGEVTVNGQRVDAEAVVKKAGDAVLQSARNGRSIRFRLSPPELGVLKIEIARGDQGVQVRLQVESAGAQKVLNDNLSQLRESLTQQGMNVERIELTRSESSSEQQAHQERGQHEDNGSGFQQQQDSSGKTSEEEQQQHEESQTDKSGIKDESESEATAVGSRIEADEVDFQV
ncbi:flagellar hook-length control protein FliK [Calycomorphotria hydatis]|uniref:Flagellar hook-length control protein FliK n=1 Tax=Calycomorphotria hydatis TaxID=2528027 RepID=A0A517TBA9_9PLAN|nr:flagellar hook-length control protein FliK [Calycomorphotria hydatis]QDT65645.1 Flagellar hook-length control protein FliK [Calycomorphotria hydatis]